MIRLERYKSVNASDFEPFFLENEHQVVTDNGYLITDKGVAPNGYLNCADMVGKYVVAIRKENVGICKSSEDLTAYGFRKINEYWYSEEYLRGCELTREVEKQKVEEKEILPGDSRIDAFNKILSMIDEIEGEIEFIRDEEEELGLLYPISPVISDIKKIEEEIKKLES